MRLNNVDWLNGRYNFNASSGDPVASVVNQGELRSSLGGRIALLTEAAPTLGEGAEMMRRLGDPQDLVGTAVFLAAPASAFMTGQTLFVDGGCSTGVEWPIDQL